MGRKVAIAAGCGDKPYNPLAAALALLPVFPHPMLDDLADGAVIGRGRLLFELGQGVLGPADESARVLG